jgi:hypothetical protein
MFVPVLDCDYCFEFQSDGATFLAIVTIMIFITIIIIFLLISVGIFLSRRVWSVAAMSFVHHTWQNNLFLMQSLTTQLRYLPLMQLMM